MTYDPVDTNDDGIVDADVNNDSVSTDDSTHNNSYTDPAGNSYTDLVGVGGAGYSSGDLLMPLQPGISTVRTVDFTTTSYGTTGRELFSARFNPADVFPSSAQLRAHLAFGLTPGTDETVSVRVQDVTESETVIEITGITSFKTAISKVSDYNPSTLDTPRSYRLEVKADNGNNSSTIRAPVVVFGVKG